MLQVLLILVLLLVLILVLLAASVLLFFIFITHICNIKCEAAGISGKAFPYSQVMKSDSPYSVEGLPSELPLRHPKNYGSKQLKEIIKIQRGF